MSSTVNNEKRLRQFLLGELPEKERTSVEDHLFSEPALFEELLALEDDLIDEYVADGLSAAQRQVMAARLSASGNSERLGFARTLRHSLDQKTRSEASEPGRLWTGWLSNFRVTRPLAWATALLFVTGLVGIWFLISRKPAQQATYVENKPTPASTAGTPQISDSRLPGRENLATPNATPSPRKSDEPARGVIATMVLTPGLTRDTGAARDLALPSSVGQVQFKLDFDAPANTNFRKYQLSVSTADGSKIWNGTVRKTGSHIAVVLPATLFKHGDYVMELRGASGAGNYEALAEYSFRIIKN